jgi:hypothetical protein
MYDRVSWLANPSWFSPKNYAIIIAGDMNYWRIKDIRFVAIH